MSDKAYELRHYPASTREVPAQILDRLSRQIPSVDAIKEIIASAYTWGFYDGQNDIIEKAAAIQRVSEEKEK